MKVLIVCSGNICRSPMAEAYMKDRLGDAGLAHVVVESAGTLGIEGATASREAIRVLADEGIDLTGHRSQGLRKEHLRTADLVLVMSIDHLADIEARGVDMTHTHLLRAFEESPVPSTGADDVPDPIGCSIEVYREVFESIRNAVDHVLIYLRSGTGP